MLDMPLSESLGYLDLIFRHGVHIVIYLDVKSGSKLILEALRHMPSLSTSLSSLIEQRELS